MCSCDTKVRDYETRPRRRRCIVLFQLEAAFEAYLDGGTGADLSSSDLISLGEFACGPDPGVIGSFDLAEFG